MHEPFEKMMNNDSWHRALMKLQSLFDDIHEESVQGLTLSRRSEASMELFAGLGRWEESEQMAISVLAMRSGKRERIARVLFAFCVPFTKRHQGSDATVRFDERKRCRSKNTLDVFVIESNEKIGYGQPSYVNG